MAGMATCFLVIHKLGGWMDGWVEMSYAWPPVMSILFFHAIRFGPGWAGEEGSCLFAGLGPEDVGAWPLARRPD